MDNNERSIGTIGVRPSIDAIAEVRILTNSFSADSGRAAGAVINVITKSGTNIRNEFCFVICSRSSEIALPPAYQHRRRRCERGRSLLQKTCASCHSATGDLKGFGSKISNPKTLQRWWLMPFGGRAGGAGAAVPAGLQAPRARLWSLASGQKVEGTVDKIDDFNLWLMMLDGTSRSFDRVGNTPKIEINNPLEPHLDLLPKCAEQVRRSRP